MNAYVFSNIDSMHRGGSTNDNRNDINACYAPPAPSMMVPLEHPHYQQQQLSLPDPQSHQQQPMPPTEFICNVSGDDTVERDIDLEIEARIRSLTLLSDDSSTTSRSRGPSQAPPPSTPEAARTMSQRMLSSLQKNKATQSQRRTSAKSRAAAPPPVRSEQSFYATGDAQQSTPAVAAPVGVLDSHSRSGDLRGTHLSTRSYMSCADRLEARISKTFLDRQDSIESADANDFSVMYSGRRTYPAESIKKNDQRLSEGTRLPAKQQQETSMTSALERERHALAVAGLDNIRSTRVVEPVVEKVASKHKHKAPDSGVSFHFHGASSSTFAPASTGNRALGQSMRTNRLALTATDAPLGPEHHQQQSLALVVPTRSSAMHLDPKYTALASQLGDIEKLIDSIESCLSASTLPSLAPVVLGELDLLKGATAQIRTNGATLILAEVGRPPTETIHALRRLVARAAAVQKRIEAIMVATQRLL